MGKKSRKECQEISEADLLLEIAEDNRMRSIGIDPDGDSMDIMIALEERISKAQAERAAYLERLNAEGAKSAPAPDIASEP